MIKEIADIRIKLKESYSPIRRRVRLDPNMSLDEFHLLIQIVMGWKNCHLYHFLADGVRYTPELLEEYIIPEEIKDYVREEKPCITTTLKDILISKKIIYEYDFRDSWKHEIILNRFIKPKEGVEYPICVAAKGLCPPEDIGGIGTFNDIILEVKSGVISDRILEKIEDFDLAIEKLKNVENNEVGIDGINEELKEFEKIRKMDNEELLEELYKIGSLPSKDDDGESFPFNEFDYYLSWIKSPIDCETAKKLINLSSPPNTSWFDIEEYMADLVEECENYINDFQKIMKNVKETQVKNILKTRMEEYLKEK